MRDPVLFMGIYVFMGKCVILCYLWVLQVFTGNSAIALQKFQINN
jgi:hypothetical protein